MGELSVHLTREGGLRALAQEDLPVARVLGEPRRQRHDRSRSARDPLADDLDTRSLIVASG